MKGEVYKLTQFYVGKKVNVELVNPIDKRMHKFLTNRRNYQPKISTYQWIRDNYISDKYIIRMLGYSIWRTFSLDEKIEFKALLMIRKYVWGRFHQWNAKHVNRWVVKYAEDTDFKITLTSRKDEKSNTGTGAKGNINAAEGGFEN